jgi:hypothetical protein
VHIHNIEVDGHICANVFEKVKQIWLATWLALRGTWYECWPGDQLYCPPFFIVFHKLSRWKPGWYLKQGHDCFFACSYQPIIICNHHTGFMVQSVISVIDVIWLSHELREQTIRIMN